MFDTERISANAWFKTALLYGIMVTEEFLSSCRGRSPQEVMQVFRKRVGDDLDNGSGSDTAGSGTGTSSDGEM